MKIFRSFPQVCKAALGYSRLNRGLSSFSVLLFRFQFGLINSLTFFLLFVAHPTFHCLPFFDAIIATTCN